MSKRNDSAWRDHASAALLLKSLDRGISLPSGGPVLVAGARLQTVGVRLAARGLDTRIWNRRTTLAGPGSPWPDGGPFVAAMVRLPRGKDELVMLAHAVASLLERSAPVLLYGAKDEGIESAAARVLEVWGAGTTLAVGGHCRVLRFEPSSAQPAIGANLQDWRVVFPAPRPELGSNWVSYPGVFGHKPLERGQLDEGTEALLDALPKPASGARVLDFGCGSGPLAAAVRHAQPESILDLVDVDALALEAARENVPGARLVLSDHLPPGPYDLVVSNPPFHSGKAQTVEILERLIEGARNALGSAGRLIFVTQRRLRVDYLLRESFRTFGIALDRGPFRVWTAGQPRRNSGSNLRSSAGIREGRMRQEPRR